LKKFRKTNSALLRAHEMILMYILVVSGIAFPVDSVESPHSQWRWLRQFGELIWPAWPPGVSTTTSVKPKSATNTEKGTVAAEGVRTDIHNTPDLPSRDALKDPLNHCRPPSTTGVPVRSFQPPRSDRRAEESEIDPERTNKLSEIMSHVARLACQYWKQISVALLGMVGARMFYDSLSLIEHRDSPIEDADGVNASEPAPPVSESATSWTWGESLPWILGLGSLIPIGIQTASWASRSNPVSSPANLDSTTRAITDADANVILGYNPLVIITCMAMIFIGLGLCIWYSFLAEAQALDDCPV